MSKLLKLKEYVTVQEAADWLTSRLGERVTEADVLRLALDRHLILSVYFLNHALAKHGKATPINQAEYNEVPSLDGKETIRLYGGSRIFSPFHQEYVIVKWDEEPPPMLLVGILELSLMGDERESVLNDYQRRTGGPDITLQGTEGVILYDGTGDFYRLLDENGKYPVHELPGDAQLVVVTKFLVDFEASINGRSQATEKSLSSNERNTLLTIIAALCDYSAIKHQERGAAQRIMEMTDEIGTHVDDETIRKALAKIPNALETRMK